MEEVCKRCGSRNSIMEDPMYATRLCIQCGLVYEENLSADQYEKRTFEGKNNEIKRVGPPSNPEQENELGTTLIIFTNGRTKEIKNEKEKLTIAKNKDHICILLSNAEVDENTIKVTKNLYDKLARKKNLQGRNFKHIIIALYYYALRIQKIPRSYKEIAKMFSYITEKQIKRAFNFIEKIIVKCESREDIINKEKNYVQFYFNRIQGKGDAKGLADKIIENINKIGLLDGKSPNTVAGLSLQLSYKLLNDNSGNSEDFFSSFSVKNTLNKAYMEVKPHLDKIIPSTYSNRIEELKNWII